MLSVAQVQEIRALLAAGTHSYRDIARSLGVSHGTVGNIASGRPRRETRFVDRRNSPHRGDLVRCPTCGGMVLPPCVLCSVRTEPSEVRAERRRTAGRRHGIPWLGAARPPRRHRGRVD